MNCGDVNQTLFGASAVLHLPLDVREHLASCKRCQEIARALSAPVPLDEPSPDALSQIEQRLVAGLQVVRPVMPASHAVAFGAIFVHFLSIAVYPLEAFATAPLTPCHR